MVLLYPFQCINILPLPNNVIIEWATIFVDLPYIILLTNHISQNMTFYVH
jgi:hypothetical protein